MSRANINGACVKVSAPHVIHEAIDGEVIVINLATGTYYSLKGSAAEAWEFIQQPAGVRLPELVGAFESRFDAPGTELEAALDPFLAELRDEGLVDWTESAEEPVLMVDGPYSNGGVGEKRPFDSPKLEKFTDMQDLVLLDPVHEVHEIGWPARPDASVSG